MKIIIVDDEMELVEALVERAADACRAWLDQDMETVMNRFNG